MTTIVRFRTPQGDYALPVEHVTEVRLATDLRPLPAARPGVAGVMPHGDELVTVLAVLGEPGRHVLVLDVDGISFGLAVGEVTGIHQIDDALIGPAPPGQEGGEVAGTIVDGNEVVLVLDAGALRARLSS